MTNQQDTQGDWSPLTTKSWVEYQNILDYVHAYICAATFLDREAYDCEPVETLLGKLAEQLGTGHDLLEVVIELPSMEGSPHLVLVFVDAFYIVLGRGEPWLSVESHIADCTVYFSEDRKELIAARSVYFRWVRE